MLLRKWRSSSQQLLETIPPEFWETEEFTLALTPSDSPKTMGVHWNTQMDTLHVHMPKLTYLKTRTKREVASAVSQTFDVLGWFAPATIQVKILLQQLWSLRIGWDEHIPTELQPVWDKWTSELHLLTSHPISRRYTDHHSAIIDMLLHGFPMRHNLHTVEYSTFDTSVSVALVSGKSKVAPLAGSTIPRLKLCGALLLASLVKVIAKDLSIPVSHQYMWSDSAVVLCWINTAPSRLKTYIANRVREICNLVPPEQWRYVATYENPADHISRGLSSRQLIECTLWWKGPSSPDVWPRRPDINRSRELPELKSTILLIAAPQDTTLWERYSTYDRLLWTAAWCLRFHHNCSKPGSDKSECLTAQELECTHNRLLHICQKKSYPQELSQLKKGQPVANNSYLLQLHPLLGDDGLIRVGGRLENSDLSYESAHPIILDKSSRITKLLVSQVHDQSQHAGPNTMLSILSET